MEYNPGGRVRPPESPLQRQQVPVPAIYLYECYVRVVCRIVVIGVLLENISRDQ